LEVVDGYHCGMQRRTIMSPQPQWSLAEHMALFAKFQGPKKVEATHQEGIICVGGFSNPLF
jgi:hypothetical protein